MNIQEYKKKLSSVETMLEKFDLVLADSDYQVLNDMFTAVYNSGVLNIVHLEKILQDECKLELFKSLTSFNGSLSFLVIQILAANNIMEKNDYNKKNHYFKKRCGIAINHLRVNKTIVSGQKIKDGYILNGTLTWASGYKIFDTLLIGFHEGGNEYEAMAPFEINDGFTLGNAPATFVGNSLNTIDIQLKDFFVKDEDIVSSNILGNYTKQKSASKTVHFCLYAIASSALSKIQNEEFFTHASKALESIQNKIMNGSDIDDLDKLRVELFLLSQDIVTTSMVLNGGSSILLSSYFQRLYRELIMFNSNGLNDTLKNIFKNKFINS